MVHQNKTKEYQNVTIKEKKCNTKSEIKERRKNKYKSQSSIMSLLIDKKEIVKKLMSKEKLE